MDLPGGGGVDELVHGLSEQAHSHRQGAPSTLTGVGGDLAISETSDTSANASLDGQQIQVVLGQEEAIGPAPSPSLYPNPLLPSLSTQQALDELALPLPELSSNIEGANTDDTATHGGEVSAYDLTSQLTMTTVSTMGNPTGDHQATFSSAPANSFSPSPSLFMSTLPIGDSARIPLLPAPPSHAQPPQHRMPLTVAQALAGGHPTPNPCDRAVTTLAKAVTSGALMLKELKDPQLPDVKSSRAASESRRRRKLGQKMDALKSIVSRHYDIPSQKMKQEDILSLAVDLIETLSVQRTSIQAPRFQLGRMGLPENLIVSIFGGYVSALSQPEKALAFKLAKAQSQGSLLNYVVISHTLSAPAMDKVMADHGCDLPQTLEDIEEYMQQCFPLWLRSSVVRDMWMKTQRALFLPEIFDYTPIKDADDGIKKKVEGNPSCPRFHYWNGLGSSKLRAGLQQLHDALYSEHCIRAIVQASSTSRSKTERFQAVATVVVPMWTRAMATASGLSEEELTSDDFIHFQECVVERDHSLQELFYKCFVAFNTYVARQTAVVRHSSDPSSG